MNAAVTDDGTLVVDYCSYESMNGLLGDLDFVLIYLDDCLCLMPRHGLASIRLGVK